MTGERPEKPKSNVIQGPWGKKKQPSEEKPVEMAAPGDDAARKAAEELAASIHKDQRADKVRELLGMVTDYLAGANAEFREIYDIALKSNPLDSRVSSEMSNYREWSRKQLLNFANNHNNHPTFRKKPALVVAIFQLLQEKAGEKE